MAKPNYSFQKRQKELAKKQKKEEKRLKKEAAKGEGEGEIQPGTEGQPTPPTDDNPPG
jgi:hypothetical protein